MVPPGQLEVHAGYPLGDNFHCH